LKSLLALLLALPAAAQPSHLDDQGFAPQLVEVKGTVTTDGSSSTQPVSGPFLTDTQLRATPVPVSGTISVGNALLVTTVTAAVPIQRTQATLGKFYHTSGNILVSGTALTPLMLFVNLSTNSVSAYWDEVDLNSIESSIVAQFQIYLDPVVTSSGTALGVYPGLPGQPASKMQVFHGPTVSASGTLRFRLVTVGSATKELFHQAFIIPPGSKALVSVANSSNNRQTAIGLTWAEE
jgi:hypothetical protein